MSGTIKDGSNGDTADDHYHRHMVCLLVLQSTNNFWRIAMYVGWYSGESILEMDVLIHCCHVRTTPETESMFSAPGRHKPDAFPGCQRIPILNSVGKDSTKW